MTRPSCARTDRLAGGEVRDFLAQVRKATERLLARLHGGDVGLISVHGRGSRFFVNLPPSIDDALRSGSGT